MEADDQLLKESILPGAGDRDGRNSDDARASGAAATDCVVRVVLNPSVLDRFLRRGRYHFYDDFPVPRERLLLHEADLPLLPSQRARLLRGRNGEGGVEGEEVFGYLWIRLCARLSATRAEFHRRERPRNFLLGIAWSILILILVVVIVGNYSDMASSISFSILAVLNLSPLGARFHDEPITTCQAQEIVDEFEPSFAEEGFHVNLIASSPMYIRFEKVGSSPPLVTGGSRTSSSSLKGSMSKFQERALRDHLEKAIDVRQARLRDNGVGGAWIFGIPVETLEEWINY